MALISCEVLGSCWFSWFSLPIPHAVPGWGSLALCISQTAWHKGISKGLSWGLKALLKFLFISGYVLNSSFPRELVISFQPAECQLLSQQQRVTSVSPDACQQPLRCHFFIPHTSNAWQDQGYSFPTGFAPKTQNSQRAQSMWGSEPQVMKSKTKQIAKVTLTLVCHFWRFCHFGDLNQCVHMALGFTSFSATVQPLHLVLCLV